MPDFYRITPGTKAQGGSGPPQSTDINQYAKALTGEQDVGALKLAPVVSAPASAATAALTTGTALGVGVYTYALTYITGHKRDDGELVVVGETPAGPTWAITTTTDNQTVSLTSIPIPGDVSIIGKRLYRTAVGGAQLKLVATLTKDQPSYTDEIADASLGANVPTTNTTGSSFDSESLSVKAMSRKAFETNPSMAAFARNSVAYLPDGTEVASGAPRYTGGGIMVEESAQNLLTANQSSVETDTTGFTVTKAGTTISRDITQAWQGQASLKVVTDGSAVEQGFYPGLSAAAANTQYVGSVWLKGAGTIKVELRDDANNVYPGGTTVTLTDSWQRVVTPVIITGATAPGANALKLVIWTATAQAVTFYADGLQIEQRSYATSWHIGGGTRAAETPQPPLTSDIAAAISAGEFTLEFDYTPTSPPAVAGRYPYLWQCVIDSNNHIILLLDPNGRIYVDARSSGVSVGTNHTSNPSLVEGQTYRIGVRFTNGTVSHWVNSVRGLAGELACAMPVGTLPATSRFGGASNANGVYGPARFSVVGRSDAEMANTGALSWDDDTVALYDWNDTLWSAPRIGDRAIWHDGNVGKNAGNQAVIEAQAFITPTDTRSWVATAWDADNNPTTIEVRDGATVVATITRAYNAEGLITSQTVAAGGKTTTSTVNRTGERFDSITRTVT